MTLLLLTQHTLFQPQRKHEDFYKPPIFLPSLENELELSPYTKSKIHTQVIAVDFDLHCRHHCVCFLLTLLVIYSIPLYSSSWGLTIYATIAIIVMGLAYIYRLSFRIHLPFIFISIHRTLCLIYSRFKYDCLWWDSGLTGTHEWLFLFNMFRRMFSDFNTCTLSLFTGAAQQWDRNSGIKLWVSHL